MKEQVIDILNEIKPDVNFEEQTAMVDDHILESMEILQLVSDLGDEFDIDITLPYIKPENFQTVDAICAMIQTILDEE